MICCDILGLNALDVYLRKDTHLSESKQNELDNILQRLRNQEPIQYICGTGNFCGRPFKVTPDVLIPRQETEELVEHIIAQEAPTQPRILDIGTGSGCIAITLSLQIPDSEVTAIDISEPALQIARSNNEALGAKVSFIQQDLFMPFTNYPDLPFDIIVSNPPYVTESEKGEMEPNVLDWEPALALFVPDKDPLLYYRRMVDLSASILREGGRIYLEINRSYAQETVQLLEAHNFANTRVMKDISGNNRFIMATK